MKVYGIEITEHQSNRAITYMKSEPFTCSLLAVELINLGVPESLQGWPVHNRLFVADRVADRLIQKHRGSLSIYSRKPTPQWIWKSCSS